MPRFIPAFLLLALLAAVPWAEEYPDPVVDDAAPVAKVADTNEAQMEETHTLEPVRVDDSTETLDAMDMPTNMELKLQFLPFEEVYFEGRQETDPSQRSIREEISIDLIDLRTLSRAIAAQRTPNVLRLSLEDCILIALDRNPDLLITGLEPLKAQTDITAAKAEFHPTIQSQITVTDATSQANQQIQAFGGISQIVSESTNWQSAFVGKLKLGTQYSLSYTMNKEATTFGLFQVEFDSFANLSLTQPLLRGFGRKYNTVRIKGAGYAHEAAQRQLEITVMNTMSEVIKAYWDLVGTIENLRVQQEALRNAERLLKINETRREIGTAADIEVLQAKAGVATRQSELIAARAQIGTAEDRLKLLLDLQSDRLFSTAQIVPIDRPVVEEKLDIRADEFEIMREASIEKALQNRPEIHLAKLEVSNAELEVIQRRNETLPQLDAFVTYGQGGRSNSLTNSLAAARDRRQHVVTYGFQGSVPLGNRMAESAYVRSQLGKKQSELRVHQTEQQLMFNVHVAVRNVLTNKILMESNRQATRLQEVNVVAEEKRLRLGTSTSFEVLRIQSDLTAAQTQQVQSQIAYEKALIDLELAEGTLLQSRGITYDAPTFSETLDFTDHYITPRWRE